ncbi:hypothetical protein EDD85DRAFT_782999 [Armillaria nabsnona]|nr:hypothetical protein EDD85DRAFT_782999 [Armillaria nabsnona]
MQQDCQNRKLLLEIPHGSKAPENLTFPGHATGWIHSDREEKQAAVNAQAIAASLVPKPAVPIPLPKIKKMPNTIKSKAMVGLDTDPETILIDEDVKMKAMEESMVVDLDSDESNSIHSLNLGQTALFNLLLSKVLLEARLLVNVMVGFLSALLLIPLLLLHGLLILHNAILVGRSLMVFPYALRLLNSVGTAWENQFQLQSKYESIQDTLKLLSADHI